MDNQLVVVIAAIVIVLGASVIGLMLWRSRNKDQRKGIEQDAYMITSEGNLTDKRFTVSENYAKDVKRHMAWFLFPTARRWKEGTNKLHMLVDERCFVPYCPGLSKEEHQKLIVSALNSLTGYGIAFRAFSEALVTHKLDEKKDAWSELLQTAIIALIFIFLLVVCVVLASNKLGAL
jgi:hypothetical protein